MAVRELDKVIGETNKRQMTLDILRTAKRPMSTAECAQELATRHGCPGTIRAVTIIGKRLSPILSTLEKAGRVGLNREGDWAEDRIDRRLI
ncbi:hypothetical protein BPNPMPFG_007000 (plasmid) [Mesorhizobium sp. AR07]|uniref:hypothetical protein n=1 Tax=Mesorhizobium sp. AR07 TaxID=2865838 RepID=UPI00215DEDFE|nr:hypothetical protein [Mesorhizobium sp. AR07]UVK48614.1 hypothetical protein BPNPMPFG_007000 [Mesorhizobium sp. AR07]